MIKYLVFDFDGVLYDSNVVPMERHSFDRTMDFFVQKMQRPYGEVKSLADTYYQKYGSSGLGFELHHNIPIASQKADIDYSLFQENTELRDILNSIPLPKVIFSNARADYLHKGLASLGLREQFSKIFSLNSAKTSPKPFLKAYQDVLSALGAQGDECIFFEDSIRNLETAKKAGMHTVLCRKTFNGESFIDASTNNLEKDLKSIVHKIDSESARIPVLPLLYSCGRRLSNAT